MKFLKYSAAGSGSRLVLSANYYRRPRVFTRYTRQIGNKFNLTMAGGEGVRPPQARVDVFSRCSWCSFDFLFHLPASKKKKKKCVSFLNLRSPDVGVSVCEEFIPLYTV